MWQWTMRCVCVSLILGHAVTGRVASAEEQDTASAVSPIQVEPGDWPWWRGQNRNGIAPSGQKAPTKWSATEGVRWKAPLPGKGHGSPIVVGEQVIVNAAVHEPDRQLTIAFHQIIARCVDRNQRGGTTGVYGYAGPIQAEDIGEGGAGRRVSR